MNNDTPKRFPAFHSLVLAINFATLVGVFMILFMGLPGRSALNTLADTVEAQNWLIGKMSKQIAEQEVELAKLKQEHAAQDSRIQLESMREESDKNRRKWKEKAQAAKNEFDSEMNRLRAEAEIIKNEHLRDASDED